MSQGKTHRVLCKPPGERMLLSVPMTRREAYDYFETFENDAIMLVKVVAERPQAFAEGEDERRGDQGVSMKSNQVKEAETSSLR